LAYAHYQTGNYAQAEAVYRVMVAGPNPDPRDEYNLGRTLEKQGKLGEATHWIGAAAAADPGFTRAVNDLNRLTAGRSVAPPPPHRSSPRPQSHSGAAKSPLDKLSRSDKDFNSLIIPGDDERLQAYVERANKKALADWWTSNWFGIPWPVRVGGLIVRIINYTLMAVLLIVVLYFWIMGMTGRLG
jgi:hypothetical protein